MSLESLEFLLDLDAKVDGLTTGLETIDRSIKALQGLDRAAGETSKHIERAGHASHGAAEAHKKHEHAIWQLGHQYEYVKNGIHEFAEAIGLTLAYEAIEKIVDKVKELGEEILHAAAKAERTEKSFKLLLGDEGGDQLLGYLDDLHKHTEFSLETLQGLAASLLRVGFAGKGLQYAVAAAADLAALPGGNLEQAAFALEQAKRTGRVDNRTLRGLGVGEKDFLAQLSSRTGKPSDVLKKDLEKGKIDADQALATLYDLIRKKTGRALGDAAEDMSTLMAAKLTHFKEVPEELFKQLEKSPAFERLKAIITDLTERLDPKSPLGMRFFEAMDKGLTRLDEAIEKIDMDKLVDDFSQLVDKLPAIIDLLVGAAKATLFFGKAVVWVYEHTIPGQILKTKLDAHEGDSDKAHKAAVSAMDTVKALPASAGDQLRSKLWGSGEGAAEGLAEGLKEGAHKVDKAVAHLSESASGGLEDHLEINSPSKVFERIGRMSGEGYLDGLDASTARAPDTVPPGTFARPAIGGGGAAGPVQVTVHIETHVNAGEGGESGAGEQLGQQVASHVEAILPGALESAFQRMQQEAGS